MSNDLLREIHGDIKVIKMQVDGLVKHSEKISERLTPVENDYQFRRKLYKLMISGAGLLAVISTLVSFWKKH